MREPRIPVMILGEASWQDPSGRVQTVPVCMEDKSARGACIRVKTPIGTGARLEVHCRREQFIGISRYCRNDGKEFLVGIQRDNTISSTAVPKSTEEVAPQNAALQSEVVLPKSSDLASPTKEAIAPTVREKVEATVASRPLGEQVRNKSIGSASQISVANAAQRPETVQEPQTRNPMRHKWFELAGWHIGGNGNGRQGSAAVEACLQKDEANTPPAVAPAPRFDVELLSMQDIYRSAGIMNLRGYGVHKVVEMLRSEHIRGLSKELKRAAVLMALETAGIPIDQVLRDAKARKLALDSYEAIQKKQIEAEWARKAEENVRIEAELEQIKSQYLARISRNQESVECEKATFTAWLASKQQEEQSISEAAELCNTEPKAIEAALPN